MVNRFLNAGFDLLFKIQKEKKKSRKKTKKGRELNIICRFLFQIQGVGYLKLLSSSTYSQYFRSELNDQCLSAH